MPRARIRRFAPHLALIALTAAAALASVLAARALPLPDRREEYNTAGFVVRHAWVKFAWVAARPFRDDPSRADEDALVARFFDLNDRIALDERIAGDQTSPAGDASAARGRLDGWYRERSSLENRVERILEGRLTAAIKQAGLTRRIGADVVWPPVVIEFEDPPSLLVTSPRSVIKRSDAGLLQGDLTLPRVQKIEADRERDGVTSALVVRLGGIAMYPALIPYSASYEATMETAAHEWMHQYLFFAPLGRDYYRGGDLVTLNETVANIAGAELGCLARGCPDIGTVRAGLGAPSSFDFATEMRQLRIRVDALLAAGHIDEAEADMEATREFIAENGIYIRRINQAYFAFHGSYADTPASSDPIGPKLQALRKRAPSLETFVETVRGVTSQRALDELLGPAAP
jgi:hypothetical protein